MLCELDFIVDHRYSSRDIIVPQIFADLGFEKESDVLDYLEDVSSMGLVDLYERNFEGKGGVKYHHFMNFAKRAHVSDDFLINLAKESFKSGKLKTFIADSVFRHFQMTLALSNRAKVLKFALALHGIKSLPRNFSEMIASYRNQGGHQMSAWTLVMLADLGVNLNLVTEDGRDIVQVFRAKGRYETARNIEIARKL